MILFKGKCAITVNVRESHTMSIMKNSLMFVIESDSNQMNADVKKGHYKKDTLGFLRDLRVIRYTKLLNCFRLINRSFNTRVAEHKIK
jgi:hypothetical protein